MPTTRPMQRTIRECREACGLTQEELARLLGIRQEMISRWERGLVRPSFEVVQAMAAIFNQSLDEIIVYRRDVAV